MSEPLRSSSCSEKHVGRGRRPDPRKREAIIEAAAELFASTGFGITMDTVATRAGVSKQTIYNLFNTKDDLFSAVIADRGQRIFDVLSHQPENARPEDVLRQLAGQFLALIAGGPAVCVQRMIVLGSSDGDLAQRFYENGPRRALTLLAGYLRSEVERGRLDVPDPEVAAEAFFGMLNGHIQTRTLMGLQTEWPQETLNRKADYAVEVFLKAHGRSR